MATEIWETTNNLIHKRPKEPGMHMYAKDIDMKWIQMPDNLGGKRVNVTEKRRALCSYEKHSTMAYFLENGYICAYCEIEKGFMWHKKIIISQRPIYDIKLKKIYIIKA